jgi:hypothetical protein
MTNAEDIPFHDDMKLAIFEKRKFGTSRNKNYGPGIRSFWYGGIKVTYNVYDVIRLTLDDVAKNHYEDEGFITPDAFIFKWISIHPEKGFVPEQKVWYHKLEVLSYE